MSQYHTVSLLHKPYKTVQAYEPFDDLNFDIFPAVPSSSAPTQTIRETIARVILSYNGLLP
jgi:hypothetical protein